MSFTDLTLRKKLAGPQAIDVNTTLGYLADDAADIEIIEIKDSDGVETALVSPTNYTVVLSGTAPSDGTLTVKIAIPAGSTWYWRRKTTKTQGTSYTSNDKFPAKVHERIVDKLAMAVLDLEELNKSALRTPIEDEGVDMELPSVIDRKGKIIQFNATTGAPDVAEPGDVAFNFTAIGQQIVEAADAAAERAIIGSQEDVITTKGDVIIGDSSNDAKRLGLGTDGDVLTSGASQVSWVAPPIAAEGDLLVGDSGGDGSQLALGTDGDVLTAGASTASWETPPITTEGDIIVGDVNGDPTRLAMGAEGLVLAAGADTPLWVGVEGTSITTEGDIIVGDVNDDPSRLGIGAEGNILTAGASGLSWETPVASPVTDEGDLIVADSGGLPIKLPLGTDKDVLIAGANTASWVAPPITTEGDLLIGNASGDGIALPKGTEDQVLVMGADAPVWADGALSNRGLLQGLKTLWVSGSVEIQIEPGECRVGTATNQNKANFKKPALWSKTFVDPNPNGWIAGNGNAGVPTAAGFAAAVDTWHLFALKGSTSGNDYGFDTDVDAANLVADTAVQATCTGTVWFRRLWSFVSSTTPNFRQYTQIGDKIIFATPRFDVDISGDFTQISLHILDHTPSDVILNVQFRLAVNNQSSQTLGMIVTSVYEFPLVPTYTAAPGLSSLQGAAGNPHAWEASILIDELKQFAFRQATDDDVNLRMTVLGWIDRRGRDD